MHENVLNFKIDLAAGAEGAIRYIDIAKCMSMVNRKLYRQQGLWHVLGARAYAQNLPGGALPVSGVPYSVSIRGAPRSWPCRNSLVKAFEAWKDQQQLAYESTSRSIKPVWQDFKVYLNAGHFAGTEITPTAGDQFGATDPYTLGEWVHSKLVIEAADGAGAVVQTEPEMWIVGNDAAPNVGLIKQYAESRALVQSPDPVLPGGIEDNIFAQSAEALADQVEEIIENMDADNDEPPYDRTTYPGGGVNANVVQCFAAAANSTGATLGRFLNLNGFSAPNGLLELQVELGKANPDVGEFWIQLIIGKREAY